VLSRVVFSFVFFVFFYVFVVSNPLKIYDAISDGIPQPVSDIVILIKSTVSKCTEMVIHPCYVNLIALLSKLMITCFSLV